MVVARETSLSRGKLIVTCHSLSLFFFSDNDSSITHYSPTEPFVTIYDTFHILYYQTICRPPPTLFYIRLHRRRLLYSSSGRALTIKTIVLFYILLFIHITIIYLYIYTKFMIIIAIKITNIILLLSLDSFPVVNPRRDDSVGKIDKIILLTTCLPVVIII